MEHGGAPRTLSAGGGADLEKPLPAGRQEAAVLSGGHRRRPDGRPENTPIADFIFEKIKNNDCRKISFEWLYSTNYIITLISCSDIPAGEYYLAWTGISDNTHPLVKRIQILS